MIKKLQIISSLCFGWVVLFFIIFLQPLFAVRIFNQNTYLIFRILSLITSLVGVIGGLLYGYVFYVAVKTKQLAKPLLWMQISLLMVSGVMIVVYLIPISVSK